MHQVTVDLGSRSYPVVIGRGALDSIDELIPASVRRVALVTQAAVPWRPALSREVEVFEIPPGETAKTLAVVESVCSAMSRAGFTRADAVLAVGGGVVTDVGGFVASVYHRGIPVVHAATTLLAQIDAAIGGKTGVNLAEGKNLVGTYWQPSGVVCDLDTLDTLPQRDYACGLGELAKYHWLGGGRLDELDLADRIAACVRIKAEIVGADEREGGRRAVLNYGHTLAHAIETTGRYDLRHGEAVAIGLIYAAELAYRLGRIGADDVAEHRRVVDSYDLPMTVPTDLGDDEIIAAFGRDKKATREVTFVLDGPNGVEGVVGIDETTLRDALAAVRPSGRPERGGGTAGRAR